MDIIIRETESERRPKIGFEISRMELGKEIKLKSLRNRPYRFASLNKTLEFVGQKFNNDEYALRVILRTAVIEGKMRFH